jgi:outer membrane immunogenic protein
MLVVEMAIEMKRRVLAAALLSFFATSSFAADMAVKAPPPVAAPAAPSWTGFYVGASAGYGWGQDGGGSFTDYPPGSFAASFAAGQTPRFVGDHPNGFVGGGQAGYNYQINTNWLVGLEGDFSGTGIKGGGTYFFAGVPGVFAPTTTTVSQSLDWLATVRARAGYVFDRLLIYGTGGVAFGQTREAYHVLASTGVLTGTLDGTTSSVRSGWAAGAGTEYKVTRNISVKAEWIHYDLGKTSTSAPEVLAGAPQTFGLISTAVTRGDIARGGVNLQF